MQRLLFIAAVALALGAGFLWGSLVETPSQAVPAAAREAGGMMPQGMTPYERGRLVVECYGAPGVNYATYRGVSVLEACLDDVAELP